MTHVERVPEPPEFHREVRKRGSAWLEEHPDSPRPHDYWSPFRGHLAEGFQNRCGYSAMYDSGGTVDHFRSVRRHPELTYEWSNYRYAAHWINSSKQSLDDEILDPFEVQDGWFEILLPSLQLVTTPAVPPELRGRAEFTLDRLHLRDDERVIRQRRAWMQMYEENQLTLEGLARLAPLLARAIEKAQALRGASQATPPSS